MARVYSGADISPITSRPGLDPNGEYEAVLLSIPEGYVWGDLPHETREGIVELKRERGLRDKRLERRREDMEGAWAKYYRLREDAGLETGALYRGWDSPPEVARAPEAAAGRGGGRT